MQGFSPSPGECSALRRSARSADSFPQCSWRDCIRHPNPRQSDCLTIAKPVSIKNDVWQGKKNYLPLAGCYPLYFWAWWWPSSLMIQPLGQKHSSTLQWTGRGREMMGSEEPLKWAKAPTDKKSKDVQVQATKNYQTHRVRPHTIVVHHRGRCSRRWKLHGPCFIVSVLSSARYG